MLNEDFFIKRGWKIDGYATKQLEEGKWLEFYFYNNRLRKWCENIDEWDNHSKTKHITFQCTCYDEEDYQMALKLMRLPKTV